MSQNTGYTSIKEHPKIEYSQSSEEQKPANEQKTSKTGKNTVNDPIIQYDTHTPQEMQKGKEDNIQAAIEQLKDNSGVSNPDDSLIKGLPNIKIRHREFINNLIDKNSDTYDHIGKAYAKAYNRQLDNCASSEGSQLLKKPKIQTYLQMILNKQGASVEDRVNRAVSIASGNITPRIKRRQVIDKTGTKVWIKEEIVPSYRDSLQADNMLNKLEGIYNDKEHANKIAELEYKELIRRNRQSIKYKRNVTSKNKDIIQEATQVDGVEGD